MTNTHHTLTVLSPNPRPTGRHLAAIHDAAADADELPSAAATDPVAESLCRRLAFALWDLGLAELLPADWAHPDGSAVSFGTLPRARADRLVRRLEDIARELPEPATVEPGAGQLFLF